METNEILTLYTGLKDKVYTQMHQNMETCHKMYNLDFASDIEVPDGFQRYIPPTAYWIIQTGSNQLITDSPTVDVEAVSDSEKAQKCANIMKEFSEFLLKQMEIQNEASPLKECAVNMCVYGMGVLKGPLFDATSWKDTNGDKEQAKADAVEKRNNFPIYFRAIDPRTFYPDPSGRKTFAIESFSRLALDIHNNWPSWKDYSPVTPFGEISWLEYWSRTNRSYLADSKEVNGIIPNVYKFVPYAWGYSGWGKTSPDGKPEDKAIGLLNPIISALTEEARFKSAMGNHFRQNVYQPYAIDPSIKGEIRFGPGDTNSNIPVRDGKIDGVAVFPVARINPDTYPILGSVLQDIQNTSASALLSGQTNGDPSGYLQGIMVGQGRIKFRPPLRALENMASQVIRNTLYMIKYVIKQPVPYASGKFIKPDDILEPIVINVSLEPQDPAENDRKIKLGLELESRGIISKRSAREEYAGVSDVEESQQMLIEQIKQLPQYQALLLGQALETYEMKALLEKLKQMEANGGLAAQAAPYVEGTGGGAPAPTGMKNYVKEQQRLGPAGGATAVNSQPENNIVNTGVQGTPGQLPVKRGMVV